MQVPIEARDAAATAALQAKAMRVLVALGNLAVPSFPYAVSKAVYCEGLALRGRATVEVMVQRSGGFGGGGGGGSGSGADAALGLPLPDAAPPLRFVLMVDGYAAPITAGNFVDLVQARLLQRLAVAERLRCGQCATLAAVAAAAAVAAVAATAAAVAAGCRRRRCRIRRIGIGPTR